MQENVIKKCVATSFIGELHVLEGQGTVVSEIRVPMGLETFYTILVLLGWPPGTPHEGWVLTAWQVQVQGNPAVP